MFLFLPCDSTTLPVFGRPPGPVPPWQSPAAGSTQPADPQPTYELPLGHLSLQVKEHDAVSANGSDLYSKGQRSWEVQLLPTLPSSLQLTTPPA